MDLNYDHPILTLKPIVFTASSPRWRSRASTSLAACRNENSPDGFVDAP
jgi:hypothetical protein